jgi:acyl-CoA synthetase (AMP-forming)/AMP-acid ligase II
MRRDLASSVAQAADGAPAERQMRVNGSTADIVRNKLAEAPDRIIVVDGSNALSRREVYTKAVRLGSALIRRGLRRGSVVAFQLPNWSESCVISLACALYGFVLCPLLLMYRERELGFILSQAECDALFIPGVFRNVDFCALLERTPLAQRQNLRVFGVRAGTHPPASYEQMILEAQDEIAPAPVDGANIKSITFTSGTTGRPKGVLHTHDTMLATTLRCAAFWGMDDTDRLFVPSPVGHIGGSIYAFELPWLTGASAHLMDSWDAPTAVALIEREKLTFCAGATPFLQGLLDSAKAVNASLFSLRRFICGGASVPPALVEAAAAQFENAVISRAYGSTEVPLVCPGIRTREDAVHGRTTDGEIAVDLRVVDQDGNEVAPGSQGDILARSPGMFVGYLDTDDEIGQLTADGFFRMGDIGRVVDGSYLEITGRRKEIIIRMGENISPLEVENVLLLCEAIERVAVVGVPNDRTGERAVAFVTLKPGCRLTFQDMRSVLARSGLARQKFPEELHVLASIPTNSVGKVMKSELQRIAMGDRPQPAAPAKGDA